MGEAIAESFEVGMSNRWFHQIAVADVDNVDGPLCQLIGANRMVELMGDVTGVDVGKRVYRRELGNGSYEFSIENSEERFRREHLIDYQEAVPATLSEFVDFLHNRVCLGEFPTWLEIEMRANVGERPYLGRANRRVYSIAVVDDNGQEYLVSAMWGKFVPLAVWGWEGAVDEDRLEN